MKYFVIIMLLLTGALTVQAHPRVVSLAPAVSDAIVFAGGKMYLCGRSRACNAPGVETLPVAGDMGNPAVEKIIKLKPDFVISDTRNPNGKWQILEKAKIKLIFLPGEKISDFPANLRYLGRLLKLEERAEKSAVEFEREIAFLHSQIPERRIRTLIVFSVAPVISCNEKSFIHEALILAGADNICSGTPRNYSTVSAEYIIRSNPELIISAGVPDDVVKKYFSRPEFSQLAAVKKKRIVSVDPDNFCRAGKNLPQAIKNLRQQIQQFDSPGAMPLPSR